MMPRLSQVAQLTWIGSAKGHKTSRFLKLLIIIQRQWVLASVVMLSVANAQPLPHPKAQVPASPAAVQDRMKACSARCTTEWGACLMSCSGGSTKPSDAEEMSCQAQCEFRDMDCRRPCNSGR